MTTTRNGAQPVAADDERSAEHAAPAEQALLTDGDPDQAGPGPADPSPTDEALLDGLAQALRAVRLGRFDTRAPRGLGA